MVDGIVQSGLDQKEEGDRQEIVFIDTTVEGYEDLVNSVDDDAEIVLLSGDGDAIEQMAAALEGKSDIDAVHILSHGSEGEVHIGGEVLSSETLDDYADEMAVIHDAMAEDGDLLLYGCEIATGTGGDFVEALSKATGADIAASDDLTGNTDSQANWELEVKSGDIETETPFNTLALQDFSSVLAISNGSGTIDFTHGGLTSVSNVSSFNYATSSNGTFVFSGVGAGLDVYISPYGSSITGKIGLERLDITISDGSSFTVSSFRTRFVFNASEQVTITSDKSGSTTASPNASSPITVNLSGAQFQDITRLSIAASDGTIDEDFLLFTIAIANITPPSSNAAPTIDVDATPTYTEGTPLIIDSSVSIADTDGVDTDLDDGYISFEITSGNTANDRLILDTSGAVGLSGTTVSVSGTDVGTLVDTSGTGDDGTVENGDVLRINFNANITGAHAQTLAQAVQFSNTSDAPNTGNRTVTFTINDGTDSETDTATVSISAQNDAPALDAGQSPALTTIAEDVTDGANTGTTIAAMVVDGSITDVDGGAVEAIAVTAVDNTNGVWQFSTDNGGNWTSFSGTTGSAVDIEGSARLLDGTLSGASTHFVRFVPGQEYSGSATITFRAWDKTSGSAGGTADASVNGAATAFSSVSDTASVTISSVNDAPAFTGLDATPTYVKTTSAIVLDANATIADVELDNGNNYNGATLTIERNGTASGNDQFSGSGTLVGVADDATLTEGSAFKIGTTTIGMVTNNSAGTLTLTFNAAATSSLVDSALQQIAYAAGSKQGDADVQLDWTFSDGTTIAQGSGGAQTATGSVTVDVEPIPAITSATYNASTGALVVTGEGIVANGGGNDIDASLITLTGEGGDTYTLSNTADVNRDSSSQFTLTLSATDKAGLNQIFNQDGNTATDNVTTYNIAVAEDWATGADGALNIVDLTGNGVTVSAVQKPTITSATYAVASGALVVTGTNFVSKAGASNDIDISTITITGEGGAGAAHTITSTDDVEITSTTQFTVTLSGADKTAVDALVNRAGLKSSDDTAYNIAVADNWLAGSAAGADIADTTSNAIAVTLTQPATTGGGGGTNTGTTGQIVISPIDPVVTVDPSTGTTSTANTIENTGTTSGSAAIVENTNNNGNVVTATLPVATTITSEGPTVAQSPTDALTTLVNAVDSRDNSSETALISQAQEYLNTLTQTTQLDVRTIVPTSTSTTLSEPIVITGTSDSGGAIQSEAFVIDLRTMNTTTSNVQLQLNNIEFASVMGQSTITGGAGDNFVIADDQGQFISLGVGDDQLFGGGGRDIVGSGSGDDTIDGGDGFDVTFGGTGNDSLIGGSGADAARFADGFDQITFTTNTDGTISAATSSEGTDSLTGIEVYIANTRVKLATDPTNIQTNGFDEAFYLDQNADVKAAVEAGDFSSGYQHFQIHGIGEHRSMNALFDTEYYLLTHTDVADAVNAGHFKSATDHYLQFGIFEPRDTASWWDMDAYQNEYTDVAEAGVNAAVHFLMHGQSEGRLGYATQDALIG